MSGSTDEGRRQNDPSADGRLLPGLLWLALTARLRRAELSVRGHSVSDVPVEVSADVTLVGRDVTQTQRLHLGVRHTGELLEQSAAAVEAVVLARAHLQAVAVKLLAGDASLPLPAGQEHLGDLRVPPGRPQRE